MSLKKSTKFFPLLNPLMLAGSPQETFEALAKLNEGLDPNDMSELAKVARGSVLKCRLGSGKCHETKYASKWKSSLEHTM